MRGRSAGLLLASLLLLLLSTSCGDDGDPEAQPAEDSPAFVSGEFGDVPIHPRSKAVGEKSNAQGVTAQSFSVRDVSHEQLFDWYDEHLTGWTQEAPPRALGAAEQSSWRARWIRGDQRLMITTSAAPTLGGEPEKTTLQYSLSLEPAGRPLPEGEE